MSGRITQSKTDVSRVWVRQDLLSDLLFGLCLLDIVSAHFDPRGQDGSGELHDVHAKQVAKLLRSWETQMGKGKKKKEKK